MKKALLTLSGVLLAGVAMATTPRIVAGEGTSDTFKSICKERISPKVLAKKTGMVKKMAAKVPAHISAADHIIYEAPEGKTVNYLRTSLGYFISGWSLMFGQSDGAADIVYANDGYAYIHNPFSGLLTDSYLKCEVKGDKLVATLPQAIYEEDYERWDEEAGDFIPVHYDYYATLLNYTEVNGMVSYMASDTDEVQTISWTIDGDKLTMDTDYDATPNADGNLQYPRVIFGVIDNEGEWGYAGDCTQEYQEFVPNPVVAPAGLQMSEWTLLAGGTGRFINVGFDGDDVYMNNLSDYIAEPYVKGKVEGDKIVFESNQYMGIMDLDYVYFMGGTYYFDDAMGYTMYELADNITFDYDADKKVMTASEGICMMVNASSKRVYYINMYEAPVIKLRNPNPNPVPRNPVPQSYNDFFENFGYSIIMFNLSSLNAEDDILDTANMYYEVSIDGELMTFYTDDYDIEEDMTQIPYNFTDSKGIFVTGETRMVYLYFAGFETIGLQLFNVVDGTSYASPKTIWNVLDNSYIVEDNTGVEAVAANRSISMVEYFNLQGIKIERPEKGINICRTTMEDGSINVTKVLVK